MKAMSVKDKKKQESRVKKPKEYSDKMIPPNMDTVNCVQKSGRYQSPNYPVRKGWPVTHYSTSYNVNLIDIAYSHRCSRDGDRYPRVARTTNGDTRRGSRHMIDGEPRDTLISNSDYRKLVTMDWLQNVTVSNDNDLTSLLAHCVIAAEKAVQRMRLDQLELSPFGYNGPHNKDINKLFTPRISQPVKIFADSSYGYHKYKEARAVHRVSPDGTLVKDERPLCTNQLDLPITIQQVKMPVLLSGVACLPGCEDEQGVPIVFVYCKHAAWENDQINCLELAKLIMYYNTVSREGCHRDSLTVVVDARATTLPVLNALLETLYTIEANAPGVLNIVHVLADRVAQSLLFKSSVFRPQVNLKIDLLMNIDALYRLVERQRLPPLLGGCCTHDQNKWAKFRMKLEPFLTSCRQTAQFLVGVSQEMAAQDKMPESVQEAQRLLQQHEQQVQQALQDPQLVHVQNTGEEVLSTLSTDQDVLWQNPHCRTSDENARVLFQQVQDTVYKLVQLADARMHKLEQCLQLRQFEEQSSQVINWLCTQGQEILSRHKIVAANLKDIKIQEKEFEKLYISALSQIEKGNDILDDASLLGQSGQFDEVTGIRTISKELKTRMNSFTSHLEELRQKIKDTAKCYQLLDQSYEWALDAVRFFSEMKTDPNMSSDDVNKLLASLEVYLKDHPPLSLEIFQEMLDLSSTMQNDRLIEQCKSAQARCIETDDMLQLRQSHLKKAKRKLELEEQSKSRSAQNCAYRRFRTAQQEPVWQPRTPSGPASPLDVVLRRRSYAGKPSAPQYSPTAAAFKEAAREMNLCDYEDYLFSEGLITEDMSDRIVTYLPKGLSDSTLRNSRESLKGSQENLQSSNENLSREEKPNALPQEVPLSHPTGAGALGLSVLGASINSHNKTQRKTLRKAISCISETTSSMEKSARERRSLKAFSMLTGSSDSLPSLPEEDVEPSPESEEPHAWSPVPVNTHLMSRNGHGLQRYQSVTDLKAAEEEVKRRRTLALIMQEMIQTERHYVSALQFVIENYFPEVGKDDIPQSLRGKRNVIFGNLEKIYEFHSQYFLSELEHCENNPFQICHCFLEHEHEFYLYALYNKNKPKSDLLMMEYGATYFKKRQRELGDKMDLSSYLLKPVQRMGKYALLLKQIMKECPETDPEYNDLKRALEMVKFQLRHGNDLLAMDSLRDCDVNLQEQGMLLRQGEFLVYQGRRKCLRHVFLFEEMVLFSKTKHTPTGHDYYVYKKSIKTSDLGLTENIGDNGFRFEIWFRKRKMGETFVLQAPNQDVKNIWIRDLSKLLWKQAIKNRELRLTEMAKMGIGNKPCLDLKPSKNNIHDRFVNISLSSRVPRLRNSIAVSSVDHLRNGNKRPHSLISVSSTSSSSSNQSSNYGLFGTLGVTPESPLETLDPAQKSCTLSSNESGIVADMSSSSSPSSPLTEDASTQTTLRRPGKRRDSSPQLSTETTTTVLSNRVMCDMTTTTQEDLVATSDV